VPQAQAAKQRLLKHALAPARIYGQRVGIAEGTSLQGLPCHCADKAGNIYFVLLYIC
jgi:hypothetical protein